MVVCSFVLITMGLSDVVRHGLSCKDMSDIEARELSLRITGESTIHLLVSGSLYPVAHAYVEETYKRTKEHGNVWPLHDWNLQKIGSQNNVNQTNAEYASQFVAAYEEYTAQPDAEKLAALFRNFPRLSRAYIAVVAKYVEPIMKKNKRQWKSPLWKDAYEALKEHPEAVHLSVDKTIHSALVQAYQRMQMYALNAQHSLLLGHDNFLRAKAQAYSSTRNWDIEDALQEARIGLLRATIKYDSLYGVAFKTYAESWVRAQLIEAYSETALPIPRRRWIEEDKIAIRKALIPLERHHGRALSFSEQAREVYIQLEISPSRLAAIQSTEPHQFDSIDGKPSGLPFTHQEMISNGALSLDEIADTRIGITFVLAALSQLSEPEAETIRRRWLGDEIIHTRALGSQMGVSRNTISRRQNSGFRRIREMFALQYGAQLAESQNI
jgi:RNA polymerase sigma factor (sigma-70 family)